MIKKAPTTLKVNWDEEIIEGYEAIKEKYDSTLA